MLLGVGGIIVYAEMAGRVAAVSGRPTFDLVRERLGAAMALANLAASFFINLLTLVAEVAGIAIALQLATDVNYLLWLPADRAARVARDLAGEVLDDGERRSGSWASRCIGDGRRGVAAAPRLVELWHGASHPARAERRRATRRTSITRSRSSARR